MLFTGYRLNDSNMWYLVFISLSAILVPIMIMRFKNRRIRILSDKIPGPDGLPFVGVFSICLQGPEQIISLGEKIYRE